MKCPCCGWNFEQRGENREDYHCCNASCPSIEAHYHPHVGVRENWWFATRYHLPFKRGEQWYCVSGPHQEWYRKDLESIEGRLAEQLWPGTRYVPRETTILYKIINLTHSYSILCPNAQYIQTISYNTCTQEKVWAIDYMALPVNGDFTNEFNVLLSKFSRYLDKLIILEG